MNKIKFTKRVMLTPEGEEVNNVFNSTETDLPLVGLNDYLREATPIEAIITYGFTKEEQEISDNLLKSSPNSCWEHNKIMYVISHSTGEDYRCVECEKEEAYRQYKERKKYRRK